MVYCNPITALKTAKVLNHVMLCVQKDCASSSRSERNAKSRLPYRPRVDEIDDIAQSSLGDVRHAIVQLQMMCICKSDYDSVRNKKTPNPTNRTALQAESNTLGYRNRDESFSSLHGVGKLLRLQQGIDGQFEVPIDSIMERSDFPLDMSIAFMQYHCIESLYRSSGVVIGDEKNLADIALLEDIGFALDTYVDAGIFWDKQYTVNSNLLEHSGTCLNTESYPIGYAVSLASRSAGVARGLPSRSWTESARFQGWQTSRLKIESSNVIDLSADVINTNKSLYESNHEDSEDNIVEPKRKWPRSEGANQIKAASKGGFLKLTRPKVLDLWYALD